MAIHEPSIRCDLLEPAPPASPDTLAVFERSYICPCLVDNGSSHLPMPAFILPELPTNHDPDSQLPTSLQDIASLVYSERLCGVVHEPSWKDWARVT